MRETKKIKKTNQTVGEEYSSPTVWFVFLIFFVSRIPYSLSHASHPLPSPGHDRHVHPVGGRTCAQNVSAGMRHRVHHEGGGLAGSRLCDAPCFRVQRAGGGFGI